jgi:DNA-binding transcriptional ArsR family regulator
MVSEHDSPTTDDHFQPEGSDHLEALVRFYKALADPTRLRMVALLLERPMYGQELAEALGIKQPVASHHLSELRAAGVVRERKVERYHYFEVDRERLRALSTALAEGEPRPPRASREDEEARTRSIYLVDGRLTTIPTQRKRVITILETLVQDFAYGRRYSEAEVNAILARYHEDVATLRRELVGYRLLARERGIYWRVGARVGAPPEASAAP